MVRSTGTGSVVAVTVMSGARAGAECTVAACTNERCNRWLTDSVRFAHGAATKFPGRADPLPPPNRAAPRGSARIGNAHVPARAAHDRGVGGGEAQGTAAAAFRRTDRFDGRRR